MISGVTSTALTDPGMWGEAEVKEPSERLQNVAVAGANGQRSRDTLPLGEKDAALPGRVQKYVVMLLVRLITEKKQISV